MDESLLEVFSTCSVSSQQPSVKGTWAMEPPTYLDQMKYQAEVKQRSMFMGINRHSVPEFSVVDIRQPVPTGSFLLYQTMENNDDECHEDVGRHGHFDMNDGLFTAHTEGVYLFLFNGLAHPAGQTCVQLRVNFTDLRASAWAVSHDYTDKYSTVTLYATVSLRRGDRIGVLLASGGMLSASFCGFLLE